MISNRPGAWVVGLFGGSELGGAEGFGFPVGSVGSNLHLSLQ